MILAEKFYNSRKYFSDLIILSLPIIMGNLGHMFIGVTDVFVAGKHSVETLSVIGLANAILTCVFVAIIGLLTAISPVLSNYEGAGKNGKEHFVATIIYSQIVALLACIIILITSLFINKIGFEPYLEKYVTDYLVIAAFSAFGATLHFSLKEFLQAYEKVFFANFLSILAIFANLWLNYVFVFGWYGCPEMGPLGLAVATVLVRTIMGIALYFYALKFVKPKFKIEKTYYKNLLKVGIPISIAGFFEFFAFNLIAIIMAKISGIYAACQNILTVVSGVTFMVPLAISNALAVKIGFANGSRNKTDIKKYSFAGTSISILFMSFCALCYLIFPDLIIKIFSNSKSIITICTPIFFIVGIFQVFDGLQVSCGGILKGLKHTKTVLIFTFIAHWIIGFPLGLLFAFKLKLYLMGFWIGITFALTSLAIALLICVVNYIKKYKNVTNI